MISSILLTEATPYQFCQMSHVPYHTHTQTHTHIHTHIYDMTRLGHMSHDSFLWNCTPPNSTKSRNSKASVQTQIKSKSQFEFVPRDTEESEFLDLVDFGGVAISVETFLHLPNHVTYQLRQTRHVPRMKKSDYSRPTMRHVPHIMGHVPHMSNVIRIMSVLWIGSRPPYKRVKRVMSHIYEFCPTYGSRHMNENISVLSSEERWGAGVETQKNVQGEIGGWGRVPFNEPYAPSLSTISDGP